MKRLRAGLLVAFIFFCGFLVGGFFGAAVGWVGFFHKVVKGGPGAVREIVLQRAVQDLKLKPEQKTEVRRIIQETAAEFGAATAEVRPKVEEVLGHGEERIRAVLNPEQRRKFDNFADQGRQRWKAAAASLATPAAPTKPSAGIAPPSAPEGGPPP
ncbi:MAG: hypothetical protein QOE70_4074 [Chthoniobacter sp.]|jgi:Spy/CpxP family protein refolding chaperone|nr:hypothetical protein [Chthoniobacter sp.]